MKICVFGNSHASQLKLALNDGWHHDGLDFDFLVVRGAGGPHLEIKENRVFAASNSDKALSNVPTAVTDGICLDDYDAFIVSGVASRLLGFGDLDPSDDPLKNARLETWGSRSKIPKVSKQQMKVIVQKIIERSAIWTFCEDLSAATENQVFVHQTPNPGVNAFKILPHTLLSENELETVKIQVNELAEIRDMALRTLAGSVGVTLLSTPPKILSEGFTKGYFMRPDNIHGGAPLGRVVLDSLVDSLKRMD